MPYPTDWPPFFLLYLSIHFYIYIVETGVPDILYVKKIDPMVNLFPDGIMLKEADNYKNGHPGMVTTG
jgi:hypothetical protein